jgi:hypothetical protein
MEASGSETKSDMKSYRITGSIVLAMLIVALTQLSCDTSEFYDDRSERQRDRDDCKDRGGIWHDFPNGYCEMPAATTTATITSQGVTATDTPAISPGEGCNAYEHISIEAVITEQAQYDTWSSCQYYLRVTNNLPDQDIWLWIHHIHATEGGIDRDEWDSATVKAGTLEEWSFSGSFNNDSTFGHSYASEIAAILAVPECNEMHSRDNAITLSKPVQWFCGP